MTTRSASDSVNPESAPVESDNSSLSPTVLALMRFRRHRLALVGCSVLAVIAICCLLAPILTPFAPDAIDLGATRQAPSVTHLLGTDDNGRDVLSRLLYAGRVSLAVGVTAAVMSTVLGLLVGLLAGYFRGWVDVMITRLTEIVLSYPLVIVIIVLVAIIGPGQRAIILGIGLFTWPTACRVVRGQVLSLREQDFILATRSIGSSHFRIITRHLLPLVVGPLTVTGTFAVAYAILIEAALSFIGLGVRPPQPSWGNMLNDARSVLVLESMPWLWLSPGLAIAVTVLAVNFVGDGLRDAFDPRQRSQHV